ncbi:MAG TPA: SRPBCC domain-containing protein [Cyclobacteriaceae bacterium]|nr:SRPBCC domain-containing protein [Cyclobacteriaceae bacterium]
MTTSLLSDFTVDQAKRTVVVTRKFDAELALVWDAFTKKEILDQWWMPLPYKSRTKHMDFKVGGRRFFAVVGPDGKEGGWLLQKYIAIHPKTNFKFHNAFADKDENPEPTGSEWDFNFIDQGDTTSVTITITNASQERFDRMLVSGFKEGIMACMEQVASIVGESNT